MTTLHNRQNFAFASDNYSGIHPIIMEAIINANGGHETAYGDDVYSHRLNALIKTNFGNTATAYPVFNGTGANIIALSALTPRHGAVICTTNAHIHNDESNAPAYVAGLRLLTVKTPDGKLSPSDIANICHRIGDPHAPQPTTVYISQATELGTCYTLQEIDDIVKTAKSFGLSVYVDGARLANACAYLGCTFADIAKTGVDILSLGGTKNGMMMGECLVVLNPAFDNIMPFLRKNHLQLSSKHRFISAQFVAWLNDELWQKLATHANDMAQYLYNQIKDLPNIIITQKVQSNAVFAILPPHVVARLHEDFHFYDWNGETGEVRLMMSFDTTKEQVNALIDKIKLYLTQS
ncbi:threonine aldolase family protein [Moraxella oblonga]|uniref:threonine aldolase family protein n=1 Tax=Moraxella oblonga TaxID=200413 RepID=UPI00082BDAD3|nr:beta-eliminating lyase-related protein [Moraxella oblonga]